jgi:hypothetical protein
MKEIHEITENHISNYNATTMHSKIIQACQTAEINTKGLLHILVFYIDLYHIYRDQNTLALINTLLEMYEQELPKVKGDHSFSTGKAGFLYVATKLHELEENNVLVEKAFSILENELQNFIISPYTNASLASGLSGTALVLDYYHSVTHNANALKWIEQIVEKIIVQAQVSDKGVFWKDRVEKLHGLLNFPFGNAGIGYAFLKLSETYNQEEFKELAKQIYTYQSQFWDANLGWKATKKGFENHKTYKAALEAVAQKNESYFEPLLHNLFIHVGVTKFSLYLYKKTKDETIKTDVIHYLAKCEERYEESQTTLSVDKRILVGTLFHVASQILGDKNYLAKAKTIAHFVQKSQDIQSFKEAVNATKIAHFQLALEHDTINNTVVPNYTQKTKNSDEKTLQLNSKENILHNAFPRTLAYLKSNNASLIADYLKTPISQKMVFNFMVFIKKNLNQFEQTQKKQLSEILKLEISIQNLKKSIKNYAYLEAKTIVSYQKVQEIFNLSHVEFGKYVLQLNPQAKKLTTGWHWELKQGKISEDNLQIPASNRNVYLLPYYTNLTKEYWQHPNNIVLDYFKNQTTIASAIAQIKQFYQSQDAIFIDNFSQFVMADAKYVLENLDTIIQKIIQEYMAIGLLEIVEHTKLS